MPRTRKPRVVALPDYNDAYRELVKTKEGQQLVFDFMEVFTEIIDQIISDDDVWFNCGRNLSSHKPQITLHEGPEKSFANGDNLRDFMRSFIVL